LRAQSVDSHEDAEVFQLLLGERNRLGLFRSGKILRDERRDVMMNQPLAKSTVEHRTKQIVDMTDGPCAQRSAALLREPGRICVRQVMLLHPAQLHLAEPWTNVGCVERTVAFVAQPGARAVTVALNSKAALRRLVPSLRSLYDRSAPRLFRQPKPQLLDSECQKSWFWIEFWIVLAKICGLT
jgi:hypothetical protein